MVIKHEVIINFIIKRIKELDYSQNKIASELGISDQAISNWERGISFPDISYLSDIARILKTNVEILIYGVHKETNLKKNINFDPNRFAKYLSKLRKANNLTKKNLNDIINVSVQSIFQC